MSADIDNVRGAYLRLADRIDYNPETLDENFKGCVDRLRDGQPIIVVDDYDRENEGDLLLAGSKATVESIAFMARHGRGIMCLPTAGSILDRLNIPQMVQNSTDPLDTAFTVSVDARNGISTGVSASDRIKTINVMIDPMSQPEDLTRPGHLFPLRARANLLGERQGHTEAAVSLMLLLSLPPVAVIAEIMEDDGSMSRLPELRKMSEEFDIPILAIEDIRKELGI